MQSRVQTQHASMCPRQAVEYASTLRTEARKHIKHMNTQRSLARCKYVSMQSTQRHKGCKQVSKHIKHPIYQTLVSYGVP